LTERQRTILRRVADGLSKREIAKQVHLSELMGQSYTEDLLKQLGARNWVHATILASAPLALNPLLSSSSLAASTGARLAVLTP
jgi:DNA-binding NarL/FixJ family response regulator